MAQYDNIFKLIIQNNKEYCKILKPEEWSNDEEQFEDVDQRVFTFKYKVCNWLKYAENEYDKKSKGKSCGRSCGRSSKGKPSKESTRPSRSSQASSSWSSEADSLKLKVLCIRYLMDKLPVERGFSKNSTHDLLPTLTFLGRLCNFSNYIFFNHKGM